jgi:pimeloyl-ACP methyl ester carboxylesterase
MSALSSLASTVDRAFCEWVLVRGRRPLHDPATAIAEMAKFAAATNEPRFFTDAETFFPKPATPTVRRRRVASIPGGSIESLAWKSEGDLVFPRVAEDLARAPRNAIARALVYRHAKRGAPTLICIHGFMAGAPALEQFDFQAPWFFRQGLDVALVVLPFHGPRKETSVLVPPSWPGKDPAFTIEGFRQSIRDVRALVTELESDGSGPIGVVGMSLGGFVTALLATVEPRLSLAAPFIPLASTADFMRANGQIPGTPAQIDAQHAGLEEIFATVSPLRRPVRVPREGRLVFAGAADRVTPPSQAIRIADHFGVPVTLFPGGHLLQFGRSKAWRSIVRNFRERGILASR